MVITSYKSSYLNGFHYRRDRLWSQANNRHRKLVESKQLHQFLQNVYEMISWISEKFQITNDESYKDPTNLQGKMQKHQAFEAELMANKDRIDSITRVLLLFYLTKTTWKMCSVHVQE